MTAQAGSITSPSSTERQALRRRIRAARRAMPPGERIAADRAICDAIARLGAFQAARHIGLFISFDGEPTLTRLTELAIRRGKRLYAPVVSESVMHFHELAPDAALEANLFGILEPTVGPRIPTRQLDLVLTPLVAFDDCGMRMGVGRGYYDRCFGFLLHRRQWRRPKLLGVAYELQRVPQLPAQPWDVPLGGIVTEKGVCRFAQSAAE